MAAPTTTQPFHAKRAPGWLGGVGDAAYDASTWGPLGVVMPQVYAGLRSLLNGSSYDDEREALRLADEERRLAAKPSEVTDPAHVAARGPLSLANREQEEAALEEATNQAMMFAGARPRAPKGGWRFKTGEVIPPHGTPARAAYEAKRLERVKAWWPGEYELRRVPLDRLTGGHAVLPEYQTKGKGAIYRKMLEAGDEVPPIVLGDETFVRDGSGRIDAARAAGRKDIDAYVPKGAASAEGAVATTEYQNPFDELMEQPGLGEVDEPFTVYRPGESAPPARPQERPAPAAADVAERKKWRSGLGPTEGDIIKEHYSQLADELARSPSRSAPVDPLVDPQQLFDAYQKNEGFTYSPREGRFLKKKDGGFVVGAYPKLSRSVAGAAAQPADIDAFIRKNRAVLDENPANLVGAWKNGEGNLVLDVSRHVPSLEEATALGKTGREQAIWNLKKGEGVDLSYDDLLSPEQAASWQEGMPKPPAKDLSSRFKGMGSLLEAEKAAEGGMHLSKNTDKGAPPGSYTGLDPAIRGPKQLEEVRARRLAQTERGAPYAGWYIDEGGLPPDPKTGFEGGALWKTNPEHPSTDTYAAHSPQASPGTNLIREVSVEHGIRQPNWSPEKVLDVIGADRDVRAAELARAKATGKKKRVTGSSLPKSVKPMYAQQVEKHLRLRAGEPVEMGPKEGAFAGNLADENILSTIDRHEFRTSEKDPVTHLTEGTIGKEGGAGMGSSKHGVMQGENLVIAKRMSEKAAADPDYLERIGWPHFPSFPEKGAPYPVDPRATQAARWLDQKAMTDFPDLYKSDPKAAYDSVLADPMNRVSDIAPRIAATVKVPEGFDFRTPTGHDRLYLQKGVRQLPSSTPGEARPLVVPLTNQGAIAATSELADATPSPWSMRFVDNRESARLLATGEPKTSWQYGAGQLETELPVSHAGEGTGTKALLDRLSPLEQNELGPEAFQFTGPAPRSAADAETRRILQSEGVPGLRERVKKKGYTGLLGLLPLAGAAGYDED